MKTINIVYNLIFLSILLTGCTNSNKSSDLQRKTLFPSESYETDKLNYDLIEPIESGNITTHNSNNSSKFNNSTSVDSKIELLDETESSILSSYSTKILTTDDNRYNNIKIVSDRLNNYVLQPGNEFSFNNVCGPYGKDDGFLKATILLSNGKEDVGYGGGVCQLSSTLYNAVETLDLEITEHHHHSIPVAYVPENKDATVSLQSNLDFKFKNTYDYPIRFRTIYDPDNLTVFIDKI